ncbi:hypothetical protein MNBD_GAMMA26-2076 [hydrothermal vent metagenome]|uniref:ABC transporter domain-containing protein n=1 Tax=hydrothermal vent metagenome TaxID=652676 RepID=A0A3B1BQQ8_9ZZZZ
MNRLHAKQLSVSLGGNQILKSLSFELQQGEMLGLIGPNGAGKTTLLRLLAGLLKPDAGDITLDDVSYAKLSPQLRAKKMAYLAQSGTAHWPMTVERIVALGRLPHLSDWQKPGNKDKQIINKVVAQTDLCGFEQRQFNTLSGGERARVLLARALAAEPEIMLADEPVAALDLAHQLEIMTLLKQFCSQGGAVVVVLHDLRLAAHYCHRLQFLTNGSELANGTPGEVLSAHNMEQAFGIRVREETGSITTAFTLPWEKQKRKK